MRMLAVFPYWVLIYAISFNTTVRIKKTLPYGGVGKRKVFHEIARYKQKEKVFFALNKGYTFPELPLFLFMEYM